MDRVRRLSQEIVQKYPQMFGTDFKANKDQLAKIAIVHSKMLRNKIAGNITKTMIAAQAQKEEESVAQAPQAQEQVAQ